MNSERFVDAVTRPERFGPVLVAAAALLCWWYADLRLAGADEGAQLTAAARILRGDVFYRDIDAYPLPGSHYLLALAFRIFGVHLSVSRALEGVVFCILVAILYATSLRLLNRRRAALIGLVFLAFKVLGWPTFTMFSYWNLAFVAACGAVLLLLDHRFAGPSVRLLTAGLCTGIAVLSKQTVGIYLGGAAVLLLLFAPALLGAPRARWASRLGEVGVFGAGAGIAVAPLVAYFAWQGLLGEMLYSAFIRPVQHYLPTSGVSLLEPLAWWKLGQLQRVPGFPYFPEAVWTPLNREVVPGRGLYAVYWSAGELLVRAFYTSIPLAFAAAVALALGAARRGRQWAERRHVVLTLLSFAVALSAFPRADVTHVVSVYPLVLILLFTVWERAVGEGGPALRLVEGGAVLTLLLGCAFLAAASSAAMTHRLDLDRANVRIYPQEAFVGSAVRYLEEELAEDESLFVYGLDATYYFLTDRYFPWPFSQLYPGQAGGDGGRALVRLLREQRPEILVWIVFYFPGLPPLPSYAPILHEYVETSYVDDESAFERYPVPPEGRLPRNWFSIRRPRAVAGPAGRRE